jgi:D-beta-D-heptose 7-phosphate kinase / D-beta-D-heptose 1-phosphate adenosyltransferase
LNRKKVLVIGDIILDRFVTGTSTRMSQEAPIPIIDISQEVESLGGAGNLCRNLVGLGFDVTLLVGIGKDDAANKIKSLLDELGVRYQLISDDRATSIKTRVISRGQQVLRIDKTEPHPYNTSDIILPHNDIECIIISDYGLGLCTTDLCEKAIRLAQDLQITCLVDPKGDDWTKYKGATLIKPNLSEILKMIGKTDDKHFDLVDKAKPLLFSLNISKLVITRGSKGITYLDLDQDFEQTTQEVSIYDVTGAGDTTLAVLAYGILSGFKIERTIELACKAGSFVVTKANTYSIDLKDLKLL